jgi:bacillithiol biosynthesis deacetylase BshB1
MRTDSLDLLIIAAHPDDAEIALGGTILRLTDRGFKVGILDLTGGEMGTRGTQEDRAQEAASAGRLMGLTLRRNLALPDGRLRAGVSERETVAHALCEYKPNILIGHYPDDPHPDHRGAGQLARDGWYLSGLQKLADKNGWGSAQRPAERYCFHSHTAFKPSLVVDISAVFERKLDVIRAYASQLAPSSAADDGGHFLKGSDILERVTHKARTYGEAIGVRYGEPLLCPGPLSADAHLLTMLAAAPPH